MDRCWVGRRTTALVASAKGILAADESSTCLLLPPRPVSNQALRPSWASSMRVTVTPAARLAARPMSRVAVRRCSPNSSHSPALPIASIGPKEQTSSSVGGQRERAGLGQRVGHYGQRAAHHAKP